MPKGVEEGCIGSLGLADSIIEWINNKVLMYITGNYIQHPVTNHNEKEYKTRYTCIIESFCSTAEINTTCKSTILQKHLKNKYNKSGVLFPLQVLSTDVLYAYEIFD